MEDYPGRILPWARPPGAPAVLQTDRVLFGNGENALEVAVAFMTRTGQPKAEDLRLLFKKRQANRPAPVLLVVTYTSPDHPSLAAVTGTSGDLVRPGESGGCYVCEPSLSLSEANAL
jgi:hypothetical protein